MDSNEAEPVEPVEPVAPDAPENTVMKRILETVEGRKRVLDVYELMDMLALDSHPIGGELLEVALGQGLIRFEPDGEALQISDFGKEVLGGLTE